MEQREILKSAICALALFSSVATPAERHLLPDAAQSVIEPALASLRLKNFNGERQILEPMAQQGLPEAQYLLACLYRAGLGVSVDPARERSLLLAAADQQHAAAAYSLAWLLLREEPRDRDAARRWLELAAAGGHELAARSLKRGAMPLEFLPSADLADPDARRAAFWTAASTDDAAVLTLLATPELVASTDAFGRDALMRAAEKGAAATIRELLRLGASVGRADLAGTTALMLAAASTSAPAVTSLVSAGADVDARDNVGNTALMHAARTEGLEAIRVLLAAMAATANYNARNAQGWTALDFALRGESVESMQALRAAGIQATVSRTEASSPAIPFRRASRLDLYANWSDLDIGATRRSTDGLDRLLAAAPSPGWTVNDIRSALGRAVSSGNADSVEQLLPLLGVAGAPRSNGSAVDPLWLDRAIRRGDSRMVGVLLPATPAGVGSDAIESPVLAATRANQRLILQAVLEAGHDVSSVDANGQDALMLAARAERLELIELLLRHGADPARVDKAGRSALWYAAQTGFREGAARLIRPENRDRDDGQGITPIAVAASTGATDVVSVLLASGVSVTAAARSGMHPLLLAAANGHGQTVQQLLSAGAPANTTGLFGDTALIVATRNGHVPVVKLLLEAGVNRQLRNGDGNSATDIANALGNKELQALLKAG